MAVGGMDAPGATRCLTLTRNRSATSILTQTYASMPIHSLYISTRGQAYRKAWPVLVRLMIIDHDGQFLGTFTSISGDFLLCEDDAALQNRL